MRHAAVKTRIGIILSIALMALFANPVAAQTEPYIWDAAELALLYPAGWDSPHVTESDGRLTLQLAQISAANADARPPAAQTITLTIVPIAPIDAPVQELLTESLVASGTSAIGEIRQAVAAGGYGYTASGTSADGVLAGVGYALRLVDGRVLLATGRSAAAAQDGFLQTFHAVLQSITPGTDVPPAAPRYGVAWHISASDGDANTLPDARALAFSPDGALFALDDAQGVARIEPVGMTVTPLFSGDATGDAAGLGVGTDGTYYLASPECGCVKIANTSGVIVRELDGFGADMPVEVAVGRDNVAYASAIRDGQYGVQVVGGTVFIPLDSTASAPQLAFERQGRLIALTSEGQVFALEETFVPLFHLQTQYDVRDMAVDLNNNLILATHGHGVLIVNSAGEVVERLGRLVPNAPQAGDIVSPRAVAVDSSGTVYVADGDGTFGSITAFSTQAQTQRGSTALARGEAVSGILNEFASQQTWTYEGRADERVTISAVEMSRAGTLDVALRLIAPDGFEEMYNDDQLGPDLYSVLDAQIRNYALESSGTYTVIVERIAGEGLYSVGITPSESFTLSADGVTRLEGWIGDAVPTAAWTFDGTSGQVFNLTMRALSGSLDPYLKLYTPDGELFVWNDDSADTRMGTTSQLTQVTLPTDGTYTLEATRFDGAGEYEIIVVATN